MLMYTDEMDMWIAEARQEEANNQARIRATLLQINSRNDSSSSSSTSRVQVGNSSINEGEDEEAVFQVVQDDDGEEVTTIQRSVLPDIGEDQRA